MTVYGIADLAAIWERNGGAHNARVIAVSVSLAESGGDSVAVSPSSDYGLWQINSIHFGSVGIDAHNWNNVDVNARAAIAISSNGTNWGPWCTCWQDPGLNCGHYLGPNPQPGTPAAGNQNRVAQALGNAGQVPDLPPQSNGANSVTAAWGTVQGMFGTWGRIAWTQSESVRLSAKGLR